MSANNLQQQPNLADMTDYQRGILQGLSIAVKINADMEMRLLYAGTNQFGDSPFVEPQQRAHQLALHATIGQALRTEYWVQRNRATGGKEQP